MSAKVNGLVLTTVLSGLVQVYVGFGLPSAVQLSVTVSPSFTFSSLEMSVMFGETRKWKQENYKKG